MKKITIYFTYFFSLYVFCGCEPLEDRLEIGGAIAAEQLDITATPLVINGVKTNKIILDNKSPVLSSWDYGIGVTERKSDTVLAVVTGENEIVFTGLNPDGSKISKTLTVQVDELTFPVPPEWGILTGGKEKTWKWDETKPAVWGNGGYMASEAPAWWVLQESAMHGQVAQEGVGAKMILSLRGAKLTKVKANGQTEVGSFSFDMSKKIILDNGMIWAKGKFRTKAVTVLGGISPNEGNAPVYEFDILLINENELVLCYPEPGVGAWGTAWFWVFRAVD